VSRTRGSEHAPTTDEEGVATRRKVRARIFRDQAGSPETARRDEGACLNGGLTDRRSVNVIGRNDATT
jgi:hypothetical protein